MPSAKQYAVETARRLSRFAWYRRVGAAATRRDPKLLMRFTAATVMVPSQDLEEFGPLLELLRADPPRRLLEIGTYKGGTFFMLCQVCTPDAHVATIDLTLPPDVESFGRPRQHVATFEGSSTSEEVRKEIGRFFDAPIDVLFIDGDHEYEGVKADFELYSPLVRHGGHVVFHDIVPDDGSGSMWVGGVPEYWQEIKQQRGWETRELVHSWEQGGLGIGVATRRVP